jgi:hypothetical protein
MPSLFVTKFAHCESKSTAHSFDLGLRCCPDDGYLTLAARCGRHLTFMFPSGNSSLQTVGIYTGPVWYSFARLLGRNSLSKHHICPLAVELSCRLVSFVL